MGDTIPLVDPLLGLELQGYLITRHLSAGGMGIVYEGRHQLIGRRAAIKVLRPELDRQAGMTTRFLREAQALSAIEHRNVVEILNFGALPGGAPWLMMEFLEGETLAQVIAREAPMRPARAFSICKEILAGLAAAHQVGVIHRDLKPSNVVLMKQSTGELIVKVVDFGLARVVDEPASSPEALRLLPRIKGASQIAGTPEYISPEQAAGEPVGVESDLYALGVILFEMLTGRTPFVSPSPWELLQMHQTSVAPLLSALVPEVDPSLEAFVAQLLAKHRLQRPSTAGIALQTIEGMERGGDRPPGLRRATVLAGGLAVLLPLALALGVVATMSRAAAQAFDDQLARFDERFTAGELAGPGGDSALDHLLAARAQDPGELRVQRRATQLVDVFSMLAQKALDRGDDAEAAVHLQALLLAAPGHPGAAEKLRAAEKRVRLRHR